MSSPWLGPAPKQRESLQRALRIVGDRWTLLVAEQLLGDSRTFGDLQAGVGGISTNVLADRLRRLEDGGLVVARPYRRRPIRYVYELTADGASLADTIDAMAAWAARRSGAVVAPRLRHTTCGGELRPAFRCDRCQRAVEEDESDSLDWI